MRYDKGVRLLNDMLKSLSVQKNEGSTFWFFSVCPSSSPSLKPTSYSSSFRLFRASNTVSSIVEPVLKTTVDESRSARYSSFMF